MEKESFLADARILEEAATGVLVASWRGVFINVWNAEATVPALRKLGKHTDTMRSENPDGFLTIAVVPTHVAIARGEARAEAERIAARAVGCTRALAYVFEGTGFAAAAVRAVVTSVMMFQRSRIPSKLFDRIEPASDWLAPRRAPSAPAIDAATLSALLLALRVR